MLLDGRGITWQATEGAALPRRVADPVAGSSCIKVLGAFIRGIWGHDDFRHDVQNG